LIVTEDGRRRERTVDAGEYARLLVDRFGVRL
jgi:hypothetical protein